MPLITGQPGSIAAERPSSGGGGISVPALPRTFTVPGYHGLIIPAGISQIRAKIWGAAGGSGYSLGAGAYNGGDGGAGGYAEELLTVTPGEALVIFVGDGGVGGPHGPRTSNGGQGGGLCAIFRGPTPLLIAGSGGGGGSASSTHNYTGGNGGAGGGTNGVAGSNDGTGNNFGGPGGQQAEYRTGLVNYVGQIGSGRYRGTPGYGYNYMICYEHQDTYNFLGGAPGGVNYAGSQACGGGGGDGYCGGIGGAGDNYLYGGGGGGGGSGYTGYGTLTAGSGRTPPNTSDSDYDGVAGVGGLGASSGAVNAGTRGLIVVRA